MILGGLALTQLASCSSVKEFSISSGSENLVGLTKITENEDLKAVGVGTSFTSPGILITLADKSSANIYRKDNPLSTSMNQITSGDVWCGSPVMDPQNNKVAFTYSTKMDGGVWRKNEIYVIDLSNINVLKPVTQTPTVEEFNPSFSPEGEIMVYQSNRGYDGEIWLKNLASNENMLLGKGFMPALSPDGKRIAFVRYANSGSNAPSSIWCMDTDGTNVVQLTHNGSEFAREPAWSPDGKRIVFSSSFKGKTSNQDLYMINADGSGLIQLTTNESYEGDPHWSQDGNIYFISDRGAKQNKYQVWRFKAP